jgi:hypothetical protein
MSHSYYAARSTLPYNVSDHGPTSAILGSISVPDAVGAKAGFVESSGNIAFEVERLDPQGRIVQVHAAGNRFSEVIHLPTDHVAVPH